MIASRDLILPPKIDFLYVEQVRFEFFTVVKGAHDSFLLAIFFHRIGSSCG